MRHNLRSTFPMTPDANTLAILHWSDHRKRSKDGALPTTANAVKTGLSRGQTNANIANGLVVRGTSVDGPLPR